MKTTINKTVEGALTIHTFTEPVGYRDTASLGAYSDTPAAVHIDRKERGDMRGNGEYRYFNLGEDGDAAYIEQDYKRAEAANRGEWGMWIVGCEIYIETASSWAAPTVVGRAYLHGVESDSGPEYIQEVALDMIFEAREDMKALQRSLCNL